MSRRNQDKGRLAPFVPLLKDTTNTPAWRALSHGARSLYLALKSRYSTNFKNNGKIYLSTRDATEELGAHSYRDNVRRWFRELQYYGFIVMTQGGHLGVEGRGKAPHWRLTSSATWPTRRPEISCAGTARPSKNRRRRATTGEWISSVQKNRIPDHPSRPLWTTHPGH